MRVDVAEAIRDELDRKTKPPRSLGRIETLAVELGVAQHSSTPAVDPARIVVFAADHGVAAEGVSAVPSEVTAQMCANFASGGAALAVLARTSAAALEVVDVGVASDISHIEGIVHAKVAPGTDNLRTTAAIRDDTTLERALRVGRDTTLRAVADGVRAVALGEMGIGNTTSAAVLTGLLCDGDAEAVTGRGTGVDEAGLRAKRAVVHDALQRCRPYAADPRECLRQAGGLELAALVGAMLEAPEHHLPVIIDGYIVTAAALVACRIDPAVRAQLIFAHRSVEPGHTLALATLGAEPLLDLGMALGEGSGGALALPLLRGACAIVRDMATFDDAGVSGADD
ncbi:MAG: nicotinate-nucleotide--dimethylbenzimidazole phosphoribosyltransferase [Ornithinimicrobium sp.]